ncbi:uncharacterized protein A4U43_C07F7640 [Asparagus officinalis]|uniref:Exocyst complex component Sec3 PIP2-binding N-terminal domain-containing protein n=1 Tax=Asparagus officinalis TaxID=4686 RepID=A0A5P1ED70_ASPOF|nr:uncharacterized protein A4U43_C07F7640 [Asparagus officinalis]
MARSSADDLDLKRACEVAIEGTKHKVFLSIRVAKSRGVWGKAGKLGRQMAKPRVLAITTKSKGPRTKAFLRVLKYSSGGVLEPAKLYKLKHLSRVEVVQNDPSGCTFTLGFDNLRSQSVAPPQWTMRNKDDRNRVIHSILNLCKEILPRLPKVVGVDVVEMALWAKENTSSVTNQVNTQVGPDATDMAQNGSQVTVEKDLVSQAEEEDMEALLGTYVMGIGEAEAFSERLKRELLALEAANVHALIENEPLVEQVLQGLETATICVEDMDEWLGIFNVKLRHMREDIESIESRNNKLELQSASSKVLIDELDKLLERLVFPPEYAACLTGGSLDEVRVVKCIEACEWLIGAIHSLEVPNLDPCYEKMRAVKEKRAQLEKLRSTFAKRALEYLRNYFDTMVDFMINEKSFFSERGQLKRPDHAELRFKCRVYARLLQQLKNIDKNSLRAVRKAYCHGLNLFLRREAREYSNELRASIKVAKCPIISLETGTGPNQMGNVDTSAVSEAYSKMLAAFIPLLVDESSFFAHFMCFEVPANVNDNRNNSSELRALNEYLQALLDGIQEDFHALVDWAFKIDPLRCISLHGITERYLSGQKADTAEFVHLLLDDLETRISTQFGKFVDEACHQIERNERNVRQMGVLAYIPSFYDLANVVPTLAKFYHQASESYEQACTRHINMVIFIQFERLFHFARRIEELMQNCTPEEIPFQVGLSKADLRKMLKYSMSGVDKTIYAMYKKLQKNFTSEELLPSLWDKCKKDFLDKYESFLKLVAKIYPSEPIPSVSEMRDLLASM